MNEQGIPLHIPDDDNVLTKPQVREVRDNGQDIACREAGEIARWQQVLAAIDALKAAADRYAFGRLPVPRSSSSGSTEILYGFAYVKRAVMERLGYFLEAPLEDGFALDAESEANLRRIVKRRGQVPE